MRIKDFTIIIPCVSFKDVEYCIKNIRKNYKKIKIIVSLNKVSKNKIKDKNLKIIVSKNRSIGKKKKYCCKCLQVKIFSIYRFRCLSWKKMDRINI